MFVLKEYLYTAIIRGANITPLGKATVDARSSGCDPLADLISYATSVTADGFFTTEAFHGFCPALTAGVRVFCACQGVRDGNRHC